MIDKSKLKELALKSNEETWLADSDGKGAWFVQVRRGDSRRLFDVASICGPNGFGETEANFIAAANPAAILELLVELKTKDRILKSRDDELTRMALATTTSTEPAKEPAACNSALRAEPAGYQEFTDAEIEAWQNAAVRGVLSAQGQSDYLNGEPIKLYPSDLRDLMDTAVGAAVGAREAAAAGAARQGGNTCDNERWNPSEQAALSSWAINAFPNESSQGLISLGSAWKQGQAYALGTSPAPSAKQEPSDPVASEKEALRRLAVQSMADCMDMVRQDLIDMGVIDKTVAPMFIPEAIANYIKRLAAPSASASPAAPMAETFANLLRIQRAEAETGDPYMVGLYNGMAMMCANIDCDINWKPMECAPRAEPVAGSQQVPEGFALVPVEPTPEMLVAGVKGFQKAGYNDCDKLHDWTACYRAMLAAAPAVPVPVEQGWQPIETAPKDGTSILLYTGEGQVEAFWSYGQWEQAPCYATYDGCGGVALICEPTHWMPLPAAPSLQQPKEGS